ncbi:MAG: class I SAM-dependent methyltransferase [Oleiphilaceae bacterium]|nr:class I SAM-dependent methyltransferase [Oleiphilaceae bacterium]
MPDIPPLLPNSHQALLRNLPAAPGRLALLGVTDPRLLMALPGGGLAFTEHYGVLQQLKVRPDWQAAFGYEDPGLMPDSMDSVVVFMPKARSELTLRLALAAHLLREGGRVILIGEKREGIAGAVKQLKAMASDAVKLDSARHCQVWMGEPQRPESMGPAVAAFDIGQWLSWHQVEAAGVTLEVAGLPGIFSEGRLDDGTRLLLEALADMDLSGPVLDFACGAGTIGAWLHCHSAGRLAIDGVDVQAQAVLCARQTYERAGVKGEIRASDGLPAEAGRYATIVSNPPFHTGVKTDLSMTTRFLQQAEKHLAVRGDLVLVANRFLPYAELLEKHIGACRVLSSNDRYTVYHACRRLAVRHRNTDG